MRRQMTQADLAAATHRDRAQIARWERGVNIPSFENLRELLRACQFDISTELVDFDTSQDAELKPKLLETPQERLRDLLDRKGAS